MGTPCKLDRVIKSPNSVVLCDRALVCLGGKLKHPELKAVTRTYVR